MDSQLRRQGAECRSLPLPQLCRSQQLRRLLLGRPCLVHVLTGLYSKFQDSLGYVSPFTLCSPH